jgi:LPXTG-site transpeptidase (sortase) family protein
MNPNTVLKTLLRAGMAMAASASLIVGASIPNAAHATTVYTPPAVSAAQDQFPIPDRIQIDSLTVSAVIEPVGPSTKKTKTSVEWSAPRNKNVGWHDYSGRLGEGKNIVLNGHNNIFGAVFRKLYTLKAGDEIKLGAGERVVTYKVEQVIKVLERGQSLKVRLKNAEYIKPMNDDRLTIVSCWPETSNSHRIIVIARPVPPA